MMADRNLSSREVVEQFRRLYTNMRRDYEELKMRHERVMLERAAPEKKEVSHSDKGEDGDDIPELDEPCRLAPDQKDEILVAAEHEPPGIVDDVNIDGEEDDDDKYVNHRPWMEDVENTLKDVGW